MKSFSVVLKNTAILTVSEVFLKILGFLWTVYLTHVLTVELFGRYNFVNAFIGILSFLPDLGVGLIVIREIAKKKESSSQFISGSLILTFILTTLTIGIILFSSNFLYHSKEVQLLVFLASATLLVSSMRSVFILYFEGIQNIKLTAIIHSLNSFLLILGGFIGYVFLHNIKDIFLGMLIGTLVGFLITFSIFLKIANLRFVFNRRITKMLFLEGLPLGIASLSSLLYTQIDSVILNQLAGEKAVGIYNSASPFPLAIVQLLNVPFMVSLYPMLSKLSFSQKNLTSAVKKSLLIILLWSIPCFLIIYLLAPVIIPLIYGNRYNQAIQILQILIISVPFMSLSALLYKVLIILNKQHIYLRISILGAFLNVILNIILISRFSIIGASIGLILTHAFLFVLFSLFVYRYLKKSI